MSDRGVAIGFTVALHLLVFGLLVFNWSSEPELRRPPKIPPHVMAKVMDETHRAPRQNSDKAEPEQAKPKPKPEKPEPKPEPKPKPKPKPKPEPKPQPKPEPKPQPKPQPKPEPKPRPKPEPKPKPKPEKQPEKKAPDFKQPSMEELMAQEELDMAKKEKAKTDNKKPGTGDEDSTVSEETAGYSDAISSAVEQRWHIGSTYRNRTDLSVKVRIQLIPGGEVASVTVVKSSGYPHFDDSLVKAVKLASPLPVPGGSKFEQFRNFIIEFNPGDAR